MKTMSSFQTISAGNDWRRTTIKAMSPSFLFVYRQRLIAAQKAAKEATNELDVLIVEEKSENAILRSASQLHPTGSLRMPIPFRERCAYSFTGGMCVALRILNKIRPRLTE